MENTFNNLKQCMQSEQKKALFAYLDKEKRIIVSSLENDFLDFRELNMATGGLRLLKQIRETFDNLEEKAKMEEKINNLKKG